VKRLRRLIAVVKAAWSLLWSDAPVAEDTTPREPFDFERDSYLVALVKERKFLDMLDAFRDNAVAQTTAYLRSCVRAKRDVEAIQAEATIKALEDLKPTLMQYAAAYKGEKH
jgi:hypothetical protein